MKIYRLLLVFILFFCTLSFSQVKIISWNIENLGKSKSDESIAFMASTLKDYDVIALQEIVAGYGGAQAVAKLTDELNRTGSTWDYVVSDPTSSTAYKTERYAFLWKTKVVKKIGNPWLEQQYASQIDREPYYCTFEYQGNNFTLANFHAITKKMQPETEIKYFKFLPALYPTLNLIFVGDFNCPQSHTVFNPLRKMGYASAFINQKTSLKKSCKGADCLASEFDNIWYDATKISLKNSEALHFYAIFETLEDARKISDHIPITAEIWFKDTVETAPN